MQEILKKYSGFFLNVINPTVNPLGYLLLFFLMSEFISKILIIENYDFNRLSAFVKFIFQTVVFIYILKNYKLLEKELFYLLSLLLLFFFIGLISLGKSDHFFDILIQGIQVFNWYIFIFVFYAGMSVLKQKTNNYKEFVQMLISTFELVFFLNLICVIIGVIFDVIYFKTYRGYDRFGFNGLFLHASHSSYIYIIYLCYFYLNVHILDKKKIHMLIALVSSLFIGTKSVYFFIVIFGFYIFIKLRALLKIIWSLIIIVIFTFFMMFRTRIIEWFKSSFHVFYEVYNDYGFLTMLFSFRNFSINDKFLFYINKNWSFLNYLLGGSEFLILRTELELVDLVWFYGVFGGGLFLYIYYKFLLKDILSKNIGKIIIFSIFFVAFFAGSFLSNPPIMAYFFILLIFLKERILKHLEIEKYLV